MKRGFSRCASGLALASMAAAACSDVIAPRPETDLRLDVTTAPGQLPFYGLGGWQRNAPRTPCEAASYRDFDFWLGEWTVVGPAGGLAGTNRIEAKLDGCLVEEHWTGATGDIGRSMNTYDATTGEWSQYWISQFGLHLRLFGGLDDQGAMVLQGDRIGFGPGGPVPVIDRVTWTPLGNGDVNQFWDISLDDGSTFPIVAFNGTYVSTPGVVPAPPLPVQVCTTPPYRELDFMIGDWVVTARNGKVLGHSVIGDDQDGCVIEEDFTSARGDYESQSLFGWDFRPGEWYRTHMDTEGFRVLLAGSLEGGAMVMSGERSGPGNQGLHIRITIAPVGPDRFVQSWETSRNGVSWKERTTVDYTRP